MTSLRSLLANAAVATRLWPVEGISQVIDGPQGRGYSYGSDVAFQSYATVSMGNY